MAVPSNSLVAPDRWRSRALFEREPHSASLYRPSLRDSLYVLIVDRDRGDRFRTVRIFQRAGTNPMQAADGAEAVALACELEFDLILMDLQMPMLSGLQATQQIRRFEDVSHWAHVPILAYGSSICADQLSSLHGSGLDGLLDRPCTLMTVVECLRCWFPGLPAHRSREAQIIELESLRNKRRSVATRG